jgi:CheY-like chemotaxis protein
MSIEEEASPSVRMARLVKQALEKRGHRRGEQAKEVARILRISTSYAYKLLMGKGEWTLTRIETIERELSHRLVTEDFAHSAAVTPSAPGLTPPMIDGALIIGSRSVPAWLQVGSQVDGDTEARYVAYVRGGLWFVVEADSNPGDRPLFEVKRISLNTTPDSRPHGLIVEDEVDAAKNLAEYLRASGYRATTAFDIESARQCCEERSYDFYLFDWLLGQEVTSLPLIESVRQNSANVPIIVLSAAITGNKINEVELENVVAKYDIEYAPKPYPMRILAAKLRQKLKKDQ